MDEITPVPMLAVFNIILEHLSFSSKWPVTQKRLLVSQNGLKFHTQGYWREVYKKYIYMSSPWTLI